MCPCDIKYNEKGFNYRKRAILCLLYSTVLSGTIDLICFFFVFFFPLFIFCNVIGQFRLSDLGNKIDAINLSLTEWFLTHQRRCISEEKIKGVR